MLHAVLNDHLPQRLWKLHSVLASVKPAIRVHFIISLAADDPPERANETDTR
ncbi:MULTISPECIES: hypothetical protein [unclassified Paenibacillus]|uniref:hypothetical protein n=1 Tax=unclassified Paenibacillus TaxID=185978 RepID=UPI001C12512F|nr:MULTISPECIES: hypothetical protein [unclassified Paenibacillus]MBU5444436.1 hypothetical protein [Paenibacillus sp. MSJ-34]